MPRNCPVPPDGLYTFSPPPYIKREVHEKFEYQCLEGYEPYYPYKNKMIYTCTHDFTWSPKDPPKCTSKLDTSLLSSVDTYI